MILILDLDDTLYPEATYVASGFRAVSHSLASRLNETPEALQARLVELVARDGRGATFDTLLSEYGIEDASLVESCVATYREHTPQIDVFPGVRGMLSALTEVPLYLVTDGDPGVQARKIDALGIRPYFRECYRTWSLGREAGKPSLTCFELIRSAEDVAWTDLVYVGDDPAKDFVGLNAVGAHTVRVHTGRFADIEAAPGFDAREHAVSVVEVPHLLGL